MENIPSGQLPDEPEKPQNQKSPEDPQFKLDFEKGFFTTEQVIGYMKEYKNMPRAENGRVPTQEEIEEKAEKIRAVMESMRRNPQWERSWNEPEFLYWLAVPAINRIGPVVKLDGKERRPSQ